MPIEIRTYQAGDEETQAAIYNSCARSLPGFKTATAEEVRRRTRPKNFDPLTRFYAVDDGKVVGYSTIQDNGRVGYPWCLPGHDAQPQLLGAALDALRGRGAKRAFAAYRADWTEQAAFFERNGFPRVREIVNFTQNVLDLPTMVIRRGLNVTPLTPEDLPALAALGAGLIRIGQERLTEYCFSNPWIPPESFFVLRRADQTAQGIGLFIAVPDYASPLQVDSAAPCFRLGAFGTEDQNAKRINGMFSFLVASASDVMPVGLDLLSYVLARIEDDEIDALAAQAPSDAKQLLGFYQKYFRRQGSFPIFEREL